VVKSVFFFSRSEKIVIVVCLAIIAVCGAVWAYSLIHTGRNVSAFLTPSPFPAVEIPETVVVHVAGRVKKPGLYELPLNTRAVDAIKEAGGHLPSADLDQVNLARVLEDGERLYVPDRKERGDAPAVEAVSREAGKSPSKPPPRRASVDLNKATAAELEQLPDVGPVTAKRIIQFRKDNGEFRKLDDLIEVPGIGPKEFARMKPYVKVE